MKNKIKHSDFQKQLMFHFLFFLIYLKIIICVEDIELNVSLNNGIFDLNSSYVINQIIIKKTNNNSYYYLLGIFEGSNDISFIDSLPFAIIKEENMIDSGEIILNINNHIPYNYIRYIPPNNNIIINEIKIFGHYFNETEDLSEKKLFTVTNLPLIILNTENLTEPNDKNIYINSQILIINNNSLHINQTVSIKLRGQTTATYPKKPYKLKFEKKQEILEFSGKYKKWTLLANYLDKSLIRNILAFKISEMVGLEFTPRCLPIDLIMNGNFRGNYFICDQIEVKSGRIDIEEISEDDETGGYLLEIDARAADEEKYFRTDREVLVEIKYPDPEDITEIQENYIKEYMNILERNVYNRNTSYIDINSFSLYFIVQEFCGDIDTVIASFHCTKRKGDDKLYFGPVWDFDRAFDNDYRLIPTNKKPKFAFYYNGDYRNTLEFFIHLLDITIMNINQTWNILLEKGFNFQCLQSFIDEKEELLWESANLNNLRWYGSKLGQGQKDYRNYVNIVINYVEQRFYSLSNLISNYSINEFKNIESTNVNQKGDYIDINDSINNESTYIFQEVENITINYSENIEMTFVLKELNNKNVNESEYEKNKNGNQLENQESSIIYRVEKNLTTNETEDNNIIDSNDKQKKSNGRRIEINFYLVLILIFIFI